MADAKKKKLGVYWDIQTLYFVDTEQSSPRRMAVTPFAYETLQKAMNNTLSPEGTKTIAFIQEILRRNKINNNMINLSLPSRDIIFRSFIVPWMQSKEIKSVVEFEATKYIPFALKELAYSYHAMNVTKDGNRRLRIIFVAIKKETLKRYTKLLDETALHVSSAEPAPLSLIRALAKKEKIKEEEEVVAIVEKKEKFGRIVIVQQNTPLFVREFQLNITDNPAADATVDAAEFLRLTNEVRISLDYFNRQEKEVNVSKILYLTDDESKDVTQNLSEDLELPVEAVRCQEILDNKTVNNTSFISTYGAALKDDFSLDVDFDLSKEAPKSINISRKTFRKNLNLKEIVPTATVCLLISFLSIALSNFYVTKRHAAVAKLEEQLGPSKELPLETIQMTKDKITQKLAAFQNIRLTSDGVFFLTSIPQLLPEGTWLNTFTFTFIEVANAVDPTQPPKIEVTMDVAGYAYAEQKRDQFQLINNLLQIIKDNEKYKELFKEIRLEDVRAQVLDEAEVTSFRIRFQ